jgi:hypothetical protein|tara:strand:- start:116 stop:355 length:240 start_codon:yes stop_codon:yes gene_type:complete
MSNKDKRYVVQMEMYVYAENDYMAKKRANDLRLSIDNRRHSQDVEVKEIGEQPFASTYYRKLDNPTFTPKEKNNEPLPF